MDVAELTATLRAEIGGFLRNLDVADAHMTGTRAELKDLERTAGEAARILNEVKVSAGAAAESRSALDSIERSLSRTSATALAAADALDRVKVGETQAAETKVATTEIVDQLDEVIARAELARIALHRVNAGGSGGGGGGGGGSLFAGILPGGARARPAALGVLATLGIGLAGGPIGVGVGAGALAGASAALPALLGAGAALKLAFSPEITKAIQGDADAFKALTPSAKEFVTVMRGDVPILGGFQKLAQDNLLPRVASAIEDVTNNSGDMRSLANAVGSVSQAVGQMTEDWARSPVIREIGDLVTNDAPLIRQVGDDLLSWASAGIEITNAFRPLQEFMLGGIDSAGQWVAGWTRAAEASGRFDKINREAELGMREGGAFIGSFLSVLRAVAAVMDGPTNRAVVDLTDLLGALAADIDRNRAGLEDLANNGLGAIEFTVKLLGPPLGDLLGMIDAVIEAANGLPAPLRDIADAATIAAAVVLVKTLWSARTALLGMGTGATSAAAEADAALQTVTAAALEAATALRGVGTAAAEGAAVATVAEGEVGAAAVGATGEVVGLRAALLSLGSGTVLSALGVLGATIAAVLAQKGDQGPGPPGDRQLGVEHPTYPYLHAFETDQSVAPKKGTALYNQYLAFRQGKISAGQLETWMEAHSGALTSVGVKLPAAVDFGATSEHGGGMGAGTGSTANPYVTMARAAARRYGVPEDLFLQQIRQESGFNPKAHSAAGAQGIAQFMPATAAGMGVNPNDPRSSLYGAARLMASYIHKYGSQALALAAYNGGPGSVEFFQKHGYFPAAETTNYVDTILKRSAQPFDAFSFTPYGAAAAMTSKKAKGRVKTGLNLLPAGLATALEDAQQAVAAAQNGDVGRLGRTPMYSLPGQIAGLLKRGNIDLANRQIAHNADGSISTVRSIDITQDGRTISIPTVINGKVVSNAAAIAHYKKTGQNLGTFSSQAAADAYDVALHNQQAKMYAHQGSAGTGQLGALASERAAAEEALAYLEKQHATGKQLIAIERERVTLQREIAAASKEISKLVEQQKKDETANRERKILGLGSSGADATPSVVALRSQAKKVQDALTKSPLASDTAIRNEIKKINQVLKNDFAPPDVRQAIHDKLTAVTNEVKTQSKAAAAAAKQAAAEAKQHLVDLANDAKSAFESIFTQYSAAADAGFDQVTSTALNGMQRNLEQHLKTMQVMVQASGLSFLFGGSITKTPAELELDKLQRQHTTEGLQQSLQDAQDAVANAQGGDSHVYDAATGITTTTPGDPQQMKDALRQLADAQYNIKVDELQQEADLQRAAADEQLQNAQDAYSEQQSAAMDSYRQQRELLKQQMDGQVALIVAGLEDGSIATADGLNQITAIWEEFGVPMHDAAFVMAGKLYSGLAAGLQPVFELLAQLQSALISAGMSRQGWQQELGIDPATHENASPGVPAADLAQTLFGDPFPGMTPEQIRASIIASLPGHASGASFVARQETAMRVGEGTEPELVQVTPLSKLRGGRGGGGDIVIPITIGTFYGDEDAFVQRVTPKIRRELLRIKGRNGSLGL